MQLDNASLTLSPLPSVLSHGLVAVSTFGLLSFFCSLSLFSYLSYRLISWRLKSKENYPINQFLFLIYNLLLADIQQACAFLLNISALQNNAILVGTTTCFAQGVSSQKRLFRLYLTNISSSFSGLLARVI
jgi:uncharacterized protein YggT (Ycf19 family)